MERAQKVVRAVEVEGMGKGGRGREWGMGI